MIEFTCTTIETWVGLIDDDQQMMMMMIESIEHGTDEWTRVERLSSSSSANHVQICAETNDRSTVRFVSNFFFIVATPKMEVRLG